MEFTYQQYCQSAQHLKVKLNGFVPKVAMILGSGLGYLGDMVQNPIVVPYEDIPHLKSSTAPGHQGQMVFGTLAGQPVAVMQGRTHHYEGYSYEEVSYAVRVLHLVGCQQLIVTNAAGCVREDWNVGEIMLITDHIKIFMESPLRGPNIDKFGTRFPDMSTTYTPKLQEMARAVAGELKMSLREGVYMYFPGPQFETPAEVRFARIAGGDAVGMSTVPEAIVARHCGMEILGFTLLTNMAAGILDQPLSGAEVNEAAEAAREHFSKLALACLAQMGE